MNLAEEQAAINRRQRIAEALMQQGQEPLETNQIAGGYVVPVSPLAGVAKVAQQLAGAYTGRKADERQIAYNQEKMKKIVDSMGGESVDYGKLAGAVDTETMANILMQRQTRKEQLADRLEQKRLELEMPTTGQRDALYAAGGNEAQARQLLSSKIQNPLGILNYQLQANNAAVNQDFKQQELELRRQEAARKAEPSEWQQYQIQQKEEKQAALEEEKAKATEQAAISSQQVLDQASKLFNHPGRKAATGASSFLSKIPGTDAKDFQTNLDTFKAQTFVPMVSALKGMGALSDAEGKKLSESVGALSQEMTEKGFEDSLKEIAKTLYKKAAAAGLNVNPPEFAVNPNDLPKIKLSPENDTPEIRQKIQQDFEKTKPEAVKNIGSKTYIKINGEWFEQ